jgi:hypothetical protein
MNKVLGIIAEFSSIPYKKNNLFLNLFKHLIYLPNKSGSK